MSPDNDAAFWQNIREAYADYRNHQHPPVGKEDIHCLNLTSGLGERRGAVLKHHDAEVAAGCDELRAAVARFSIGYQACRLADRRGNC